MKVLLILSIIFVGSSLTAADSSKLENISIGDHELPVDMAYNYYDEGSLQVMKTVPDPARKLYHNQLQTRVYNSLFRAPASEELKSDNP